MSNNIDCPSVLGALDRVNNYDTLLDYCLTRLFTGGKSPSANEVIIMAVLSLFLLLLILLLFCLFFNTLIVMRVYEAKCYPSLISVLGVFCFFTKTKHRRHTTR